MVWHIYNLCGKDTLTANHKFMNMMRNGKKGKDGYCFLNLCCFCVFNNFTHKYTCSDIGPEPVLQSKSSSDFIISYLCCVITKILFIIFCFVSMRYLNLLCQYMYMFLVCTRFLHLFISLCCEITFYKSPCQTMYCSSGVLNGVSDDSTSSDDDESDESDDEEKSELQFGKFFPGKVKGVTKKGGNNVPFHFFFFF